VQDQSGLPGRIDGAGDVQIVGEALVEVLPVAHRRVLRIIGITPIRWPTEFVASCDLVLIIGALVAEDLAAIVKVGRGSPGINQLQPRLAASCMESKPRGVKERRPGG
jgi:hypothetical protein